MPSFETRTHANIPPYINVTSPQPQSLITTNYKKKRTSMPETVWAIHNFEAEADDEISFHIGEPIVILQKDELYQDGWWEVSNPPNAMS